MIIYKNRKFSDRVDLWAFLVYEEQDLSPKQERLFPHSNYLYVKAHLEEKFYPRKFTIMEIKQILAEELALKTITLKDETGSVERLLAKYLTLKEQSVMKRSLLKSSRLIAAG